MEEGDGSSVMSSWKDDRKDDQQRKKMLKKKTGGTFPQAKETRLSDCRRGEKVANACGGEPELRDGGG